MRRAYLALIWLPGGADAEPHAQVCTQQMDADPQWRRAADLSGLRLWVSRDAPPDLRRLPHEGGLVVGAVHDMPDALADPGRAEGRDDPEAALGARALALSRRHWGAYVAILRAGRGEAAVYRDPGGGLDCLTWSLGDGLEVVASQISPLPLAVGPRHPFLNWDRIAAFVALPSACAAQSLFDEVVVVDPGGFRPLQSGGSATTRLVWSPTRFVREPIDDAPAAARELVARVDACTHALVGAHERVLLELSGGLDSSILAGSVAATGLAGRVAEGVNFTFGRPESDETAYAQAVAERLGAPLTCLRHTPASLDEASLAELADAFHPAANSVDPAWDRDEIARLRATGARAVVSGQGGDAVFFQMPGAAIAADAVARDGWSALAAPVVADVARRARTSVWAVAREVWRLRRRGGPAPDARSALVASGVRDAAADLAHSWVRQARADGVSPGKQLHILAASIFHGNLGPRRRRREADVVYPLFAQPVLEHCLADSRADPGGRRLRPGVRPPRLRRPDPRPGPAAAGQGAGDGLFRPADRQQRGPAAPLPAGRRALRRRRAGPGRGRDGVGSRPAHLDGATAGHPVGDGDGGLGAVLADPGPGFAAGPASDVSVGPNWSSRKAKVRA